MSDTCKEECTFTRWQCFFKLQVINLEASKIITKPKGNVGRCSSYLYGWISSRIQNFTSEDTLDRGHGQSRWRCAHSERSSLQWLGRRKCRACKIFQKEVKEQKMRTNRSLLSPPQKKMSTYHWRKSLPSYRIVELTWSKEKRKYCRSEFNHCEIIDMFQLDVSKFMNWFQDSKETIGE